MQTVLVPPNADAGPNQYTPSPIQAHYLNVREDPHDGDATILSTLGASREVWTLDVSAIPDGSQILALRIRSVQKQSTAGGNTYRVGFVIGGFDYLQPNHVQGAGSAFLTENDEVAVDPSDGAAWTKERLARAFLVPEQVSQAQGLPRPRLTECVVFADIVPPGHPTAAGTSQAPRAGAGSQAPGARGSGQAPKAGLTGQTPAATGQGQAPRTAATRQAPGAAASGQAPRAVTPADLPTLRVSFASQAPRAAVSGGSPQATVSPKAPKGEGS